jgi:hypothetical protein
VARFNSRLVCPSFERFGTDETSGGSMKPSAGYVRDPWMMFWFGWVIAGIFSQPLNVRGNFLIFLVAMLVLVLRGHLGKPASQSNQTPSEPTTEPSLIPSESTAEPSLTPSESTTKLSVSATELPSNVAWFERLMYLALGIALIETFLLWDYIVDVFVNDLGYPDRVSTFLMMLVSFALWVLLVWQAARRRKNWARWVLFISTVIQVSMTFYRWTGLSKYLTPLDQGLRLGSFFVLAIALFLIFTGNARGWFERSANIES